jgi:DNA-directed RNA polymerase specialized sigma24 family protein
VTLTDLVANPETLGSIRDLAAYLVQAAQTAAWDADQSSGRLACSKSVYRTHSRIRVLRRELEAKAVPSAELEARIISEFNRTRNGHDIILTVEKLRAVPTEIGTIDGLEFAAESAVEAEAEREDRIATIRALVERCSAGQPELARQAFQLRWLEGLSVTETAARLNVTATKIKSLTRSIYGRFAAEAKTLRLAGAL